MFSIGEIIELAVQIEENGERVYRKAAKGAPREDLSSLFSSLADEEVKHAEWFSELKGKIENADQDPRFEEMGKKVLQGILGDQSFSLKEAGLAKIEEMAGVLKAAIEYEEDTILFYEMIRSFVGDKETLHHLDAIIEEEHRHIRSLEKALGKAIDKK
jgi:rubrerythrin